jgi:hypothetical protein
LLRLQFQLVHKWCKDMPERIIQRARNFSPNLYFNVPFRTKTKYKIEKGNTLICTLSRVIDSAGNLMLSVGRQIECPISKRDGRFYVPPELIKELNLIGVEYYEFLLQKLHRKDGSEVEIYPNEIVEKEVLKTKI